MAELILDSLRIENFRTFRQIKVSKLGRVNLIVGKNNTGKSSMLEALYIYAREGQPDAIWDILKARGESTTSRTRSQREQEADIEQRALDIKYILHNRADLTDTQEIRIGSLQQLWKHLSLSIGWYAADERGRRIAQQPLIEDISELFLIARMGEKPEFSYNLGRYFMRLSPPEDTKGIKCTLIPAAGLGFTDIGKFWDNITLTDLEKEVIQALKIIEPTIEGLSFITNNSNRRREPVIRTARYNERLPLRSLGEGINRLLGIVLALVNAKDGLLLIDEVESGLHYSVQPDMWRLVFRVADELNIQVFATTHSKDCLEAFQHVSQEHAEEGVLIRLGYRKGDIVTSIFDETDLADAVEQDVEVR